MFLILIIESLGHSLEVLSTSNKPYKTLIISLSILSIIILLVYILTTNY